MVYLIVLIGAGREYGPPSGALFFGSFGDELQSFSDFTARL